MQSVAIPMILRTITLAFTVSLAVPALFATAEGESPSDGGAAFEETYRQPIAGLTAAERAQFEGGSKGFAQHWAVAPSILGLWGRGPTSNGEACTDCHDNGGRGRATDSLESERPSMLVRLSTPGTGAHDAPRPDPNYGDQLQEEGI